MNTIINIVQGISAFIISFLLAFFFGWIGEATKLPSLNSWSLDHGMFISIWSFLFILFYFLLRSPFDIWRKKVLDASHIEKRPYPVAAMSAFLVSIFVLQPWPLFWFYELFWLFNLEYSYPILEMVSLFLATWALIRGLRNRDIGGLGFSILAFMVSGFACYYWIVKWLVLKSSGS